MPFVKNIDREVEVYKKKGWVKIENFLKKDELRIIKCNINSFIKKEYKKYSGRDINFVNNSKNFKEINSFHKLTDSKNISKIAKSKKFLNIIKKFLFNEEAKFRNSELFAKPAFNGLTAPDHQDNYYWAVKGGNALTLWIALDKVSKENGPVHYYSCSNNYGLLEHEASFMKGSSQKIKNEKFIKKLKKETPTLNPGDALIHNCLTVHGSSANLTNKPRRGWTLQYKSKNSRYDNRQSKKYLKELNNQVNARSSMN